MFFIKKHKKEKLSQIRENKIMFSESMIAHLFYYESITKNDFETIKFVSEFLNMEFSAVRSIYLKWQS